MNVLIDTTIWSLALRRRCDRLDNDQARLVSEWDELVAERRVRIVGAIRQETLSGIAVQFEFQRLRNALRAFPDIPVLTDDHEQAANAFNVCRANGIQGTPIDMLLCAVAQRLGLSIFTTDRDFIGYARYVPMTFQSVREELT